MDSTTTEIATAVDLEIADHCDDDEHDEQEGPPEPPPPRVHYALSETLTLCGRTREPNETEADDAELCGACSVLAIPMVGTMRAGTSRRLKRAPCTL